MSTDKSMSGAASAAGRIMNSPLVSMVIPCYNHAAYVQQSITSIIAQDYGNIELIIIDDGSNDESIQRINEMVDQCQGRFVRFEFRARENKGLSATLNEALEWADGVYFAALASDDLLLPIKTSKLVECLHGEHGIAGAFGSAEVINADGTVIGVFESVNAVCSFDDILLHNVIVSAPTQLLDIQALKAVGGYTSGVYIEDWYLWLKLTNAGYRLKFIEDTLVRYRQHDSNISKNIDKMQESRLHILEQYQDHPRYGYAVSQIHAAAALEYSSVDRRKSIGYLLESVRHDAGIVFSFNFIYACIKIIVPGTMLDAVKRLKP